MSIENSDYFVKSLEKGLNILKIFSNEHPTLTISEASRLTGYSKPTTRRILLTLTELGYATCKNNIFSLTAHTLTLGYSFLSSQDLWSSAEPFMREFTAKVGESCSMAVLDDTDIIYIVRVPTKRIMTITLNVGSRLPAHATSMGHILLASLSSKELEHYLTTAELIKYTNKTLITKQDLKRELDVVRERGWAIAEQQLEEGLRSIAVPIKNRHDKVIAAINCSANAARTDEETLTKYHLPSLLETASKISDRFRNFSYF